ncbi:autotransporter outer membrane beta-barrel domain-containing protein [Pseudomonas sp. PB120]|uniref:autotransporter outer membrane beta-barrel domain-containing protein n=1 Tax=Pseudomonas sp. PB120 TaxID=2494700 RepID=UPI0012FD0E3D|nr:autotransporter outer membrane beta-barrel domain-containing protein [Pseudomonas sp. PB120]MVV50307.1 autotransporter outer membrane beta-barrel domain-containing protein [Pseudomonas sp. PB120]
MFQSGVRFSRFSVSGALLMFGLAPVNAFAANCDVMSCLTTTQSHVLLDDGNILNVGTGGTLIDSQVSNGHFRLWDSGQALGTTVSGDGWLQLDDRASASGTVVENGQMVVLGSATAFDTTLNDGLLDVAQNAAVSGTLLNGGSLYVYMNALAKGTTVNHSQMHVYQDANAEQTTVNDGGVLSVSDRASVRETVVNQGGRLESVAGTVVADTTVNRGGTMVLGDRAEASDTTINQGGLLQLKGDAVLGFYSHVKGQVHFADPAVNGFHTLLIKGPLSGNGTFAMNTDLAGQQGDLLRVQGQISGSHTLVVADSGNAPANARALALVDGNGGSGDFRLDGNTVDAGAFRYELQHIGEDWYLINSADTGAENLPDSPANPQTPQSPVNPAEPVQPHRPQADTLSKGANAAIASHAASAALISAQMSATTGHFAELRSGKDQGGVWTRGYGAGQHLDTGASRAFQQQVNGMEIGADHALPFADGTLYVGGLIGQGQGRQDFGEASKGTIDSTTLGGYASYLDRSGVYVDGALKYSRLDNDINVTSNLGNRVKAHFKNHAVSADVFVGRHIDLGQNWFVEPQAGLQLTRISEGRYTASNGLSVEQEAMNSVQSRVGAMLGRDLQLSNGVAVKPYAKATWITEHAGDSQVTVSDAKLDSRLPGSRGEMGGGVMVRAADKHNFFAEGGYTKGSDLEQPWAATVGYRYSW